MMKKNTVRVMQPKRTADYKCRQFIKMGGLAVVGTGLMIGCTKEEYASEVVRLPWRLPQKHMMNLSMRIRR